MKRPSAWPWASRLEAATLVSSLLLLATPSTAAAAATAAAVPATIADAPTPLACDNLVVGADGKGGQQQQHRFNLAALAGPHTVVTHEYTRPTYHNTTYTIDVCAPLRRKGEVPAEERCPDGTRGEHAHAFFRGTVLF